MGLLHSVYGTGSAPTALAIGNFVFLDYNRNGIQDTGEPGIANVRVRLFQSGIERAQVLTDANGQYSFTNANVPTGLAANTAYEVRILPTDFPTNLKLTTPFQGGNTELDSDAQLVGGNAVIFLTTNATDTPTNSYDIGFVAGNPDLNITKTASPSQVAINGSTTYTIQVSNNGSGAATNVVVRDTLDAGLAYVSSSPTATTTAYGSARILVWNLGTITSGASTALTVNAIAQTEGVLFNTAFVSTTDTENSLTNNGSRACVTVPIQLCAGQEYVANLPAGYTNVQWYQSGSTTPVATGNSFTIVQAGTYTYIATASTNCSTTACCPIVVQNGIVPTLAITPTSPTICAGQSTSLTVSGCPAGGAILWSATAQNATTASITVSPTTTTVYSVTCTPTGYGTCPGVTSTTVTVNPSVTATLTSATICNGTSATLVAGGGATYTFSNGATNTTGILVVSPTVNGTNPYSVTVTSAQGCSAVASGIVTVNPSVTATLSSATICNGTSATLTARGGSNYLFSTGLTNTTGVLVVAPTINGTNPYSVTVTSAQGCTAVATGTVTVNPSVTATLTSATICNGTSATLIAGGGTAYAFSDGTTNTTGSLIVSPTINGTNPYSVTVTSAQGCSAVASGIVTVNPSVTATLTSATICNGTSATLTAGGGSSYLFSTGLTNTTGVLVVAPTINGANPYSVTVTSAQGCTAVATGIVTVNPSVTATLTSATICNGTSATLTAGGGATYTFSNGTTNTTGILVVSPTVNGTNPYSVTVTSAQGCSAVANGTVTVNPSVTATLTSATICNGTSATLTAGGGTTYTFSNGTANTTGSLVVSPTINGANPYSVTVTSAQGCTAVATGIVTVNPSVTATLTSATICNGTSATLTAAGGSSYLFSTGLTNTTGVLVVAPTINGANPYSVTVTSAQGCTAVATGTVTVNPSVTATLTSATICNGTSATLTAGGGTAYAFSDGTTNTTGSLIVSPTINGTNPYSVTVTSAQGCSAVASGIVTVNPSVTATLTSATICNGTSATLTAGGGTNYLFSEGTANTTGIVVVAPTVNGTNPYSVTVTSAQGCSAVANGTVTVNPSVTATLTSATICNGTSATLTAAGGTTYTFSNGTANATGLLVVSPTTNGSNPYSVTVTSAQGCSAVANGIVTVNPAVTATIAVSSATVCQGQSISLTSSGGATYVWSTGDVTSSISVTVSGTYSVTATSAAGCTGTASTSVTVNPAPQLSITSATLCAGNTTTITVDGCAGGTLLWGTGDNTASLVVTPLLTTSYSATCTFPTGCSAVIATTVVVNAAPTYTVAPTAVAATCVGNVANNDARINLTTLQDTERADYSLGTTYNGPGYGALSNQAVSGGAVSFTLANPAGAQSYTVRLFSANGTCFTDVTITLAPADCQCPAPKCVPVVIRRTK